MRVAQFKEFGGLGALRVEDVPEPNAAPGEAVIRVEAVGLNFFDTLLLRNEYQITPPLPFSPGAEIAGVIESVGSGVVEFRPGQRVVAFIGGNGSREKIATKARNLIPIPAGVSDEVAAGIPVTYGTAFHALQDRAQLKPQDSIAVLGAAGGAGLAAVELAKLMGARVIAVASSSDKLALAAANGADEGINYTDTDLKAALKSCTGGKGVRRGLRLRRRLACGARAPRHGLGRTLSRARLCLRDNPPHSAQPRLAQGLLDHRRVLDLIRGTKSGEASGEHDRAAQMV